MIQTKEEYDVVARQLERVQRALESLRSEVEPKNKRNFDVMAEGYVEEIAALTAELDSYRAQQPKEQLPVGDTMGQTELLKTI